MIDNGHMEIPGHVANGVVVLDGGATLPEGTAVTVLPAGLRIPRKPGNTKPVEFPLIHCNQPGTLDLNNERIADILEAEDVAHFQESLKPNDI
jgi:hypothetical protein